MKLLKIRVLKLTIGLFMCGAVFSFKHSNRFSVLQNQDIVRAMEEESFLKFKFPYTDKESTYEVNSFFDDLEKKFLNYKPCKEGFGSMILPVLDYTCYEKDEDLVNDEDISEIEKKIDKYIDALRNIEKFSRKTNFKSDDDVKRYTGGLFISQRELNFAKSFYKELKDRVLFDVQTVKNLFICFAERNYLTDFFKVLKETSAEVLKDPEYIKYLNESYEVITNCFAASPCDDVLNKLKSQSNNNNNGVLISSKEIKGEKYDSISCEDVDKVIVYYRQWFSMAKLVEAVVNEKFKGWQVEYKKIEEIEEKEFQRNMANKAMLNKKALENEKLRSTNDYFLPNFHELGNDLYELRFPWKNNFIKFSVQRFFNKSIFDGNFSEDLFKRKTGILFNEFTGFENLVAYGDVEKVYSAFKENFDLFFSYDNTVKEELIKDNPQLVYVPKFSGLLENILTQLNNSIFNCVKAYINVYKILAEPLEFVKKDKSKVEKVQQLVELIRKVCAGLSNINREFVSLCYDAARFIEFYEPYMEPSIKYVRQWLGLFSVTLFSLSTKYKDVLDKSKLLQNTVKKDGDGNGVGVARFNVKELGKSKPNVVLYLKGIYGAREEEISFNADFSVLGKKNKEGEFSLLSDSLIKNEGGVANKSFKEEYEKFSKIISSIKADESKEEYKYLSEFEKHLLRISKLVDDFFSSNKTEKYHVEMYSSTVISSIDTQIEILEKLIHFFSDSLRERTNKISVEDTFYVIEVLVNIAKRLAAARAGIEKKLGLEPKYLNYINEKINEEESMVENGSTQPSGEEPIYKEISKGHDN